MKLDLNFASRRYVNRKAVSRAYWIGAIMLLCLLLWILINSLLINTQIKQNQAQLAVLQQDKAELLGTKSIPLDSQRIEEIRAEFARSQILLDQDSFRWTALFDRMEALLPPGVSLRGFRPDYEKRTLAIDGVAQDLPALRRLLDQLLAAEAISNVYLKRHAEIKVKDSRGNDRVALSFSVALEGVF